MRPDGTKDLVVLVADKNMEAAVTGLLSRKKSLGIRDISNTVYVHPGKDPGCVTKGDTFLRSFAAGYQHALLMFDREGCGREELSRQTLEEDLENRLARNGWANRAVAIVIDPELEMWVWSASPQVDRILGWSNRGNDLRSWLIEKELWRDGFPKPDQPKKAVEKALEFVRTARSSSIYLQLAHKVSLERCLDSAFVKFKTTLKKWFPEEA